jgi:two-component system chemotaxis response regulator CheY
MMLRRMLGEIGIAHIEDARDGEEALAKILQAIESGAPYGAIFLDWNMPKKNGFEVLQACRARADMKDVPIIMVTAEGEKKHVIKALSFGATEYIVKPCSPDILKTKIQRLNAQPKKVG